MKIVTPTATLHQVAKAWRSAGAPEGIVKVALREAPGQPRTRYAWQGPADAPVREWHGSLEESPSAFLRRVLAEVRGLDDEPVPPLPPPGTWLTSTEAAAALGITPARVRQLALAGVLPATKQGRDWMVRPADLEQMRDRPTAPESRRHA